MNQILGTLALLTAAAPVAAADRPNVVVILADDLGWGSVGCYGAAGVRTPNIDRLAKQGRKFTNAYANGSVCSPTRYGLLTGRYYWRTDVKDGETRRLQKGDVMVIPAGIPHWFKEVSPTINYLTVKVLKP